MLCFVQTFDGNQQHQQKTSTTATRKKREENGHRDAIVKVKEPRFQMVRNRFLRKSRSSSSFGSGAARSAPGTPQGVAATPVAPLAEGVSGEMQAAAASAATSASSTAIQRSPSHCLFTKLDKGSVKQLSSSTPAMTAHSRSPEPPSPKVVQDVDKKLPITSKSRQKKFHRHFPTVALDETVLNYYSCALIADILLQGRLYITKNYFAFHSNVFGYVTKLLIPLLSVESITKEKTARIIPNAVGIATSEDKHVFSSLMSRDNTYRFMNKVWDAARNNAQLLEQLAPVVPSECSDSSKSSESGNESTIIENTVTNNLVEEQRIPLMPARMFAKDSSREEERRAKFSLSTTFNDNYSKLLALPAHTILLYASTFLLLLLFLSAAILLYRIGKMQEQYASVMQDYPFVNSNNEDSYENLFQWQRQLHTKAAGSVHNFLDTNLQELVKLRRSLDALSSLLKVKSMKSEES